MRSEGFYVNGIKRRASENIIRKYNQCSNTHDKHILMMMMMMTTMTIK